MKKLMIIVMCISILLLATSCEYVGTGLGIDKNGKIVPIEDLRNKDIDIVDEVEVESIENVNEQEIKAETETVEDDKILYDNMSIQYGGAFWDAIIPAEEVPKTYFNNDISNVNIDTLKNIVNSLVADFNIEVKNDVGIFNGDISECVTRSSERGLASASIEDLNDGATKVLNVQAKITSEKPIENIDELNEVIKDKIGVDISKVDAFKGAVEKVYNAEYDYAKITVSTQKKYEYFSVAAAIGKGEEYTYEYLIDLCIEL